MAVDDGGGHPPSASHEGAAVDVGEAVDVVRGIAERASKDVERLRDRLKTAQQIDRFCGSLRDEMEANHPSQALRVIQANAKALQSLRERSDEAARSIDELAVGLEAQVKQSFGELMRSFPDAVQDAGLELDASSRHPSYSLCDGFIEVDFDKRRIETRIAPRDGRRTSLGIDLPVIVDYLTTEIARLFDRPFDGAATRAALEAAYRQALAAAKKPIGEAVPLRQVIDELSKDKSFRADEFNVDLSRLVRSEDAGRDLHLDHSRDSKNGVLLWQLDQRGYYGYIRMTGDHEKA